MQNRLGDNVILMFSTYNKGTAVVAERFIRVLEGKIYKKLTAKDFSWLFE